jgi:hypothetical protein
MTITYVKFAERLARGQLKNTSAVDNTNLGEICPDYVATVHNLTNQGLIDITTKLPLIRKLVDLTFVTDQARYDLTNGAGYLDTTDLDPFVDAAFVKVLDVYNADGRRYQPNTGGHITTPVYNSVRFSAAYRDPEDSLYIGPKIRIQYHAKHAELTDPSTDVIDIAPNMVMALQLFVASQYISDMGGKEMVERGDGYLALYLRAIGEDVVANTSGTSDVEETSRFEDAGFV